MNWETSQPLVIAHRGDKKAGPENTLPAFESALKIGADGLEMDIRRTRDGVLVVFHDEDLKRLAQTSLVIEQTDYETLRRIPLGKTYLPKLAEVLELVRDQGVLNLEIKTSPLVFSDVEAKLARLLADFRLNDSILVSSFHPQSLMRMRWVAPQIKRGYLFEDKYALHRLILPATAPYSLNAPLNAVTKKLVDDTREAGRRFFVWTVNGEDDMKRCVDLGVDGIITDEPERLLKLLNRTPR